MWLWRDLALKTGHGNDLIKNLVAAIDKVYHDTFVAFGDILGFEVTQDENGNSKGHGFVHYETDRIISQDQVCQRKVYVGHDVPKKQEAISPAIKYLNGMLLNEEKVDVGHHISKKDR
ncbi:hypothetical protein CONLIGDRAFT_649963 [Coniochaeta ligniaria NRRL 30616]|uniref:RRM domain-containing protein n=1 Tax=Coniochaeta ligniaria NRRL 30616 TaxID=1408157 RepID=A0A1J7I713_9PEZI|nr:hypothetical protein CONLIGDRAFT_649963 [Coniochaeta ligniaria NRRL 30616]